MLTIECPKCHDTDNIPDEMIGKSLVCSKCGEKFVADYRRDKMGLVIEEKKPSVSAPSQGVVLKDIDITIGNIAWFTVKAWCGFLLGTFLVAAIPSAVVLLVSLFFEVVMR